MKKPRKVALISVFDYPSCVYSAYWEIDTTNDAGGYRCRAAILSYAPVSWTFNGEKTAERPAAPWPSYPPDLPASAPKEQHDARLELCLHIARAAPRANFDLESMDAGIQATQDDADTIAQRWVLERIDKYRRTVPELGDAEIDRMVVEFDLARQARDFARADRLRGRFKAAGVLIAEPERVGSADKTTWKRG